MAMTVERLTQQEVEECELCRASEMEYAGKGRYVCPECHHLRLDIPKIERIVEQHLREYILRRISFLEEPAAATAKLREMPGISPDKSSVQESWLIKRSEDLRQIMIIDKVLKTLADEHRRFVELRYFEGQSWNRTCFTLKASSSTLAEWKHVVLRKFAMALGYM